MENIELNWKQYFNGFTKKEIYEADYNVIIIKSRILQLIDKPETIPIIEEINRLELSKKCIKSYYSLDINL
tara:strand:- start:30 stop:242 length:213 start_codon:yes stop_codon:yes gene_type:complete